MISAKRMAEWSAEYFSKPENKKKVAKACEKYNSLTGKGSQKKVTSSSKKQVSIADAIVNDVGKVLENTRYEVLKGAVVDGKKGSIKVDLINQKAEFIPDKSK